jgi:hypothetical protein
MPQRLLETLTLGQCLEFAKTHCSEVDVAILTGKLAGISARDIARTLEISESAVEQPWIRSIAGLVEMRCIHERHHMNRIIQWKRAKLGGDL